MSCSYGSVPQVRPGTARVLVTELSGSGHMNPTPATKGYEDSETVVELYLSPTKLESLCGAQDLSQVTSLEICVDTRENTLGNFGAYLPKLVQLKMNNSMIMSVRDLGTTLSHLQVLWMSRCCLQDLDGIPSFSSLKELYVAYNSVSDLSQVSMLENLQLLDLEGNDVDDLVQVQYLGLCSHLHTLTLEGNPVCVRPHPTATQTVEYSYRAAVRELVPQLRYLDDVRAEEDGLGCSSTMGEDWAMLRNSIRDCSYTQAATEDDSACSYNRPSSAKRPSSSLSCVWPLSVGSRPLTGSRPVSATGSRVLSPPGSRPGSADSDPAAVDPDTSTLTHGAGKILFCGNPVQALRARREKLRTAPTTSTFSPRDLPIHVPEHTYDLEEPGVGERSDVFAELRAWREQHSKRLQAIEMEKMPQVLTIQHSDEEEEDCEDDGEEEGLGVLKSDGSDEEDREEKKGNGPNTTSPDSSFQSLSPDLSHREALSPDVARLSLSPDSTLSPSPPLSAAAATGNRRLSGIRSRRLRLSLASGAEPPPEAGTTRADTDLGLHRVQEAVRPKVPLRPLTTHIPHRPTTSPRGGGLRDPCTEMDLSSVQSVNKHQTSRPLDRPTIMRPHTARAALQKHRQHHTLQPSRGSSHLD
uniref:leucine-rich repeat-containing protein 56 n=1 Tax=Centroberyx gerrardi TaxID=166262 RepID=UPI003AB06C63